MQSTVKRPKFLLSDAGPDSHESNKLVGYNRSEMPTRGRISSDFAHSHKNRAKIDMLIVTTTLITDYVNPKSPA